MKLRLRDNSLRHVCTEPFEHPAHSQAAPANGGSTDADWRHIEDRFNFHVKRA